MKKKRKNEERREEHGQPVCTRAVLLLAVRGNAHRK